MLRPTTLAATLTLMILTTSVALAADEPRVPGSPPQRPAAGQRGASILKKLDANKDGQLSKPEFERAAQKASKRAPGKAGGKAGGKMGARVFDRLDADKNGTLSPAEIEKLQQLRARKKSGR